MATTVFIEKMTFEQSLDEGKRVIQADIWGEGFCNMEIQFAYHNFFAVTVYHSGVFSIHKVVQPSPLIAKHYHHLHLP